MSNNSVVIVAAGRGERLGAEQGPKQYRNLEHESVLQHTVNCFANHPDIHAIQVVIHKDDYQLYESSVSLHSKLRPPVTGGKTRQESCKAGIDALDDNTDRVLIHDAARPFVSLSVISNVLEGIKPGTGALPAIEIADTIKRANADGTIIETVDRSRLYLAQTPQGFVFDEIRKAHQRAASESDEEFTDDAAVAEWAGAKIGLVPGDRNNFKITTKQDLQAAKERVVMANTIMDVRTGSGYDTHILGPGHSVILCGVEIPNSQALQGHSDADVGLHALTDALLGTIGEGDIGSHFPPSDPQWQGASSDQFLAHAAKLVSEAGGVITNLDVTIICEAPKIGPHRNQMRETIQKIVGLDDISRVSVKATTNEKVGFVGRGEGIAALATATIMMRNSNHV